MIAKRSVSRHIIVTCLYIIPALFFIFSYFFMTVTGEDIFQGANIKSGFLEGMVNAFRYNARLSDMYAWGAIRFFDYQYSFGIDTVFRIIDVILALGIVYLISMLIVGRKLRFELRDALVFATIFILVAASAYTASLYMAFSHIHNYLLISFSTLLFVTPYVWRFFGRSLPENRWWFRPYMLLTGFIFGFCSNVTPVVFLATVILLALFYRFIIKKPWQIRKFFHSFAFFGIIGILISFFVVYIVGTGFSVYTNMDYAGDYISLSMLLDNPVRNSIRILQHIFVNFQSSIIIVVLPLFACLMEYILFKKKILSRNLKSLRFVAICLLFVILHILACSQIVVSSLIRLLMPAYFVSLVAIGFTIFRIIPLLKIKATTEIAYTVTVIILCSLMSLDIAYFRLHLSAQIAETLNYIEESPSGDTLLCISRAQAGGGNSPIFNFPQAETFAEWTISMPVYGKQIQFCD